jgi:hypothetical protein
MKSMSPRRNNEHLDDFVRGPFDRLDRRIYCVSRRRGTDSLAAAFRGHFFDPPFRDWQKDCIEF